MKVGDRVQSLKFRTAVHGFPERDTEPDVKEISQGAFGTVVEIWPHSGLGIVQLDCGIRLLVANIDENFVKVEEV